MGGPKPKASSTAGQQDSGPVVRKAHASGFPATISKEIQGIQYYKRLTLYTSRAVWPFCILYALIVAKAAVHVSNFEW